MKRTYQTILTTVILLCIAYATSYSQLKVDPTGRIGMGTNWPNSGYKCHIKGDLLLTTYPDVPFIEFQFKVGNGWPGADIGCTNDAIAFWSTWTSYNKLYAEKFYRMSDSTFKSNTTPIQNGLESIMKLNAYSYTMQDNRYDAYGNKVEGFSREYGFLSQEVEKLFPDINITSDAKGIKLMDYDQIIPLLVSAVKEQQHIIDALEEKVLNLEKKINQSSTNGSSGIKDTDILSSKAVLYQNKPNPFDQETIIQYDIPTDDFLSGSIFIFDMNGMLLKSYPVKHGENETVINGKELDAGMYIYSLIVNGNKVDTKTMILVR